MIQIDFPDKLQDPQIINLLQNLSTTENVLSLNKKLFTQSDESLRKNQKLKSYDDYSKLKILKYQKKHGFSITYMSKKYNISRTTLSKWKKLFEYKLVK
ncbi:hypothetical protein GCM10022217_41190 [Chryseobacterium ginsenosidimutans]|uniref:helix-turn-helix domain-containing protein n=1 Tax=Chryseobacterium ginsenosidimutans TaxID=687846 RepID=UPI0031D757A5